MKTSTGPTYDTRHPAMNGYYKWSCPVCGDLNEDPAHIHVSTCHNGHEVKLILVEPNGPYSAAMHVEAASDEVLKCADCGLPIVDSRCCQNDQDLWK